MKDTEVCRLFDNNGLQLLKKELSGVQQELRLRKLSLRTETEKLTRLSSQLQTTKQQIDFYGAETDKATKAVRRLQVLFTSDLALQLGNMKPHPELVDLANNLLVALDL